jgi:DNA-binding MarR family transcriptional regulator
VGPPLPFDPIQEAARQWRARWPDGPVAAMAAVTSIMRVQQILLGRLNAALEPFGLTFSRYEALMLLGFSRRGALPLGKIGARLQVHAASVTNLIDGLERAGLVRRVPHPTDGRTTLAEITDAGRRVAVEATEALHSARFGVGTIGEPELGSVIGLLRELRLAAGDFSAAEEAVPS